MLGPSGCGKSTLLRAIAGFEHIDRGSVLLGERDITSVPLRERNIGFVFQNYALFPHLSVERNIAFPLDVRRAERSAIRARVRELLELVQLPGYEKRFPHELSAVSGNASPWRAPWPRIRRCCCWMSRSPRSTSNVRRDLRARGCANCTIPYTSPRLLVTHDADEAMEIADTNRAACNDGRVEQAGTPLDALSIDPVSPFALQFLGPANAVAIDGNDALRAPARRFACESHAVCEGSQAGATSRASSSSVRASGVDLIVARRRRDRQRGSAAHPTTGMSRRSSDGDTVHVSLLSIRALVFRRNRTRKGRDFSECSAPS